MKISIIYENEWETFASDVLPLWNM